MNGPLSIGRRDFLKRSAVLAMAPTIPAFLPRSLRSATANDDGRILVVIQLSGGNDGINTVIPFADEGYDRHRDRLRIPNDRVLKVDDQVGLHPSMRGARDLLEDGRLAIVQGVGYPNPNRSHDVSMAIWQTARIDEVDHQSVGWIGQAIDEQIELTENNFADERNWSSTNRGPQMLLMGDENPPLAVRGRKSASVALAHLDDLRLHSRGAQHGKVLGDDALSQDSATENSANDDLLSFVRRSQVDAFVTADLLERVTRSTNGDQASYPSTKLANRMKMIATLIKSDFGTPVYYAIQPGYDTHAAQLPAHANLLSELSGALRAFDDDLEAAGLGDRVLVMCFSEFGRRVQENASYGTDHGAAAPVLISGSAVNAGLIGETPSMTDINNGDLRMGIDFRNIYASVLADWLNLPTRASLDGSFEKLELFS